ncbi:hypothetical protein FOL47_002781 [Perkinsus chesapeaki]|uniref:Uncharacterized protein n=1 Tax=Perkinsus chesapeaki TaxID=330153 RepID=A0A7J6N013_PERCH|nr:hypothetical protein FOL47_002781 [Perkinsus chesapeaki]
MLSLFRKLQLTILFNVVFEIVHNSKAEVIPSVMPSDLARLKATGLPYEPEKDLKKRINRSVATPVAVESLPLFSYIASVVSVSTASDGTCLVLDTDHLLTTEALIDGAGVPPSSIVIPNPDDQALSSMKQKYQTLVTVHGTSHDLLRPNGGLEHRLPDGHLLRCIYLDYNGSFGRDGYKTGRRKRDDLKFLLESGFMASPCVLAISFSLRGIGETYPLEHWFNVKDYLESIVEAGKPGLHLRWLDCLRYRHNPRSSPMMFLSAITWRGDDLPPSELPSLVLDGSEALWTERIDVNVEKQRDTGLAYPRWMADGALDLCSKAGIETAYITAPHTPLGHEAQEVFSTAGLGMLWESIPRPRHWLDEGEVVEVPGIVWCCEEGMLNLRSRRRSGLREDFKTILKLSEKPRLLLWNFSYSNVGERWKHEELFRFAFYAREAGGRSLAAFNYNSPSSAVYFIVVSFDESINEETLDFSDYRSVGLSPIDLSVIEHTKRQERVDIQVAKYLRACALSLGLSSTAKALVQEGPSLCWSSRLIEVFPDWKLFVRTDDPIETALLSKHKLSTKISPIAELPTDCDVYVMLYDHCWSEALQFELSQVLAPNRLYCVGYHLVGRHSAYLLEPVSWFHQALDAASLPYTLEKVILCRSSAPYVYIIVHTFPTIGKGSESSDKLQQLKFTVYEDWPTQDDGAFTNRIDKLRARK